MKLETKKLIHEMEQATQLIATFAQGKQLSDYKADAFLRSAVERQLEIIGEAINRLRKIEPDLVVRIGNYQRIIGLRNVLIHGYDIISNEIVWDIVQNKLSALRHEIDEIKRDFGE